MAKYQMTRAAALRIAREIRTSGYPTDYVDDVLGALRKEDFESVEMRVSDLLTELRNAAHENEEPELCLAAIQLIAFACASECRRTREVMRDLRRGMSGLGVVFESDLKREALKE